MGFYSQSIQAGSAARTDRPEVPMRINHVCVSCGQLLAVCEHTSHADLRRCWLGMKKLCAECSSWPGSLPQESQRRGRTTMATSALHSALSGPGRGQSK
jgi:hypothetical protein